ncbi:MAG: 1-deoxy-D-xylulose-5-phosphate reductoisomerase [Propionibacteriaceae bacterium]|nr:1-deoxy-D-xylulose-5-phosphate reductoisomerase [Propionibacteriaceae bacterium]
MRDVIILGSTGSIGTQTLDVVSRHGDEFRVVGLAAGGTQIARLASQIAAVRPARVAVPTEPAADQLKQALREAGIPQPAIIAGPRASCDLTSAGADVVLNAITGYAGLESTLAALAAGSRLALANKESLVVGGPLVLAAAGPGQIVPVDSEHSAFAQALRGGRAEEVSRFILTASGGPFRGQTRKQLKKVTVADALAHPTWTMGRVVTINSATLVNKGLELIEAAVLFSQPWDAITVVVHPQSLVHSMVEFRDGSTIAQCSPPDMRLPIALALGWPHRLGDVIRPCDWGQPTAWTFEPVDNRTFPAVELAREVGRMGGTVPTVFNAANEVAVDAFCAGHLGFLGIVEVVADTVATYLTTATGEPATLTLDQIRVADAWARTTAAARIGRTA